MRYAPKKNDKYEVIRFENAMKENIIKTVHHKMEAPKKIAVTNIVKESNENVTTGKKRSRKNKKRD